MLDATINDSSVDLFDKLGWLPIHNSIGTRKLFMLHKVSQGHSPKYSTSYFKHVRFTHGYHTRSAICNDVLTPSHKRDSWLKTFHLSACRLWNNFGFSYGNIISSLFSEKNATE